MAKRKKKRRNIYRSLMGGALILPVGATVIGAMPSSAVTTNVMGGMSKMSAMYPTMGRLMGVGMTVGVASRVDEALKEMK